MASLTQDAFSRRENHIEAILTCEGNIDDPDFPERCSSLFGRLENVLSNNDINVIKCEPWNSVRITFDLPSDAAQKLSELAQAGDHVLRQLGILSLQVYGGKLISIKLVGQEDETNVHGGSTTSVGSLPVSAPVVMTKTGVNPLSHNHHSFGQTPSSSLLVNLLKKDAKGLDKDGCSPEKRRRKQDVEAIFPRTSLLASGSARFDQLLTERLSITPASGIREPIETGKDGASVASGSHLLQGLSASPFSFQKLHLNSASASSVGSSFSRTLNQFNTRIHSAESVVSGESKSGRNLMPPPSNNGTGTLSASFAVAATASEKRSFYSALSQHHSSSDNSDSLITLSQASRKSLAMGRFTSDDLRAPAGVKKQNQVLINPNTGMLESGLSESSSEGENDFEILGDKGLLKGSLDLQAAKAYHKTQAENALKLKLRLPVENKPSPASYCGSTNFIASSPNVLITGDSGRTKDVHATAGGDALLLSEGLEKNSQPKLPGMEGGSGSVEPKLPKLIFSIRDKTVKMAEAAAKATPVTAGSSLLTSSRLKQQISESEDSEDLEDDENDADYIDYEADDLYDEDDVLLAGSFGKQKKGASLVTKASPSARSPFTAAAETAHFDAVDINNDTILLQLKQQKRSNMQVKNSIPPPAVETVEMSPNSHLVWKNSFVAEEQPLNAPKAVGENVGENGASLSLHGETDKAEAVSATFNEKEDETIQGCEPSKVRQVSGTDMQPVETIPAKSNFKKESDNISSFLYSSTSSGSKLDPSEMGPGGANTPQDLCSLSLPSARDLDAQTSHQQGEDSGIESMDTLSEKSPNQGENFPNEEKIDREIKEMTSRNSSNQSLPSAFSTTLSKTFIISTSNRGCESIKDNSVSPSNDGIDPNSGPTPVHRSVVKAAEGKSGFYSDGSQGPSSSNVYAENKEQQTVLKNTSGSGSGKNEVVIDSEKVINHFADTVDNRANFTLNGSDDGQPDSKDYAAMTGERFTPSTFLLNGSRKDDRVGLSGDDVQIFPSGKSLSSLSVLPAQAQGLPESTIPTPPDETERSSSSTPEIPSLTTAEMSTNCFPMSMTSVPLLADGNGTATSLTSSQGNNPLQFRSAISVPPGAKIVPVKLVSVSGEGNVRLVRVSPIKPSSGSQGLEADVAGIVPTSGTVIIKSSAVDSAVNTQTSTFTNAVGISKGSVINPDSSTSPSQVSASHQASSPSLLINTKDSNSASTPPPTPPISSGVMIETSPVSGSSSSAVPMHISVPASTVITSNSFRSSFKEMARSQSKTLETATLLAPSLSILPVRTAASSSLMLGMSMEDVVESIKKNNANSEANSRRKSPLLSKTSMEVQADVPGSSGPLKLIPTVVGERSSTEQLDVELSTNPTNRKATSKADFPEVVIGAGGGGSLLRPLLQKEEAVVSQVGSEVVSAAPKVSNKRVRGDTGSSPRSEASLTEVVGGNVKKFKTVDVEAFCSSNCDPGPPFKGKTNRAISKIKTGGKPLASHSIQTKKRVGKQSIGSHAKQKAMATTNQKSVKGCNTIVNAELSVISLEVETVKERRSARQNTPTPSGTSSRPPSARQQQSVAPSATTSVKAFKAKVSTVSNSLSKRIEMDKKLNDGSTVLSTTTAVKGKRGSTSSTGSSDSGLSSASIPTLDKRTMKTRSTK